MIRVGRNYILRSELIVWKLGIMERECNCEQDNTLVSNIYPDERINYMDNNKSLLKWSEIRKVDKTHFGVIKRRNSLETNLLVLSVLSFVYRRG